MLCTVSAAGCLQGGRRATQSTAAYGTVPDWHRMPRGCDSSSNILASNASQAWYCRLQWIACPSEPGISNLRPHISMPAYSATCHMATPLGKVLRQHQSVRSADSTPRRCSPVLCVPFQPPSPGKADATACWPHLSGRLLVGLGVVQGLSVLLLLA